MELEKKTTEKAEVGALDLPGNKPDAPPGQNK